MAGSLIGFAIEGLVALLLLVTIGYCVLLSRRLRRLRADEQALRGTIAELVQATELAERAIAGLKQVAGECDRDLSAKLLRAERSSRILQTNMVQSEKVLGRLARISGIARRHGLVDHSGRDEAPGDEAVREDATTPGKQLAGRAA